MSISANKGEHSELLAFLRILQLGKLQVADRDGNPKDAWLKVISLRRPSDPRLVFRVADRLIMLLDEHGAQVGEVDRGVIGQLADSLLSEIKSATGAAFACASTDKAMELFNLSGSKASPSAKADLFLEVASPVFEGEISSLGFSIKSEIGGLPTLLNAGATQFQYKIEECSADDALAVQEEAPRAAGKVYPGPIRLLPALKEAHAKVVFDSVVNPVFEQNLKMIDTAFPRILAETLKYAYSSGELSLEEAVQCPEMLDELVQVLGLSKPMVARLVRHKIKELLRQSALGMNPSRHWNGQVEAHGGWIIVKEDGAIVCFHLVNDDEFRDYLLSKTKFDTPSMTKQKSGYVYKSEEASCARLRLSLQVRFST
jgi:hypothetical protein